MTVQDWLQRGFEITFDGFLPMRLKPGGGVQLQAFHDRCWIDVPAHIWNLAYLPHVSWRLDGPGVDVHSWRETDLPTAWQT